MRYWSRAVTASTLIFTASLGVLGCSSQTRLGYLIPAHRNSDASEGEVVRVGFYPDPAPPPAPPDESGKRREFAALAPLAAFGAKLAVDYVSSELEKEAKRYEAQFTGRVIASTQQLGRSGYLVVERWVDPRLLNIADGEVPASVKTDYEKMTQACDRLQASADADDPPPTPFADLTRDDASATKGKLLVFLFVARVVPAEVGGNQYRAGPFAITPQFVWLWKTKAKVVDLSLSESWKVWQWIGALLLKTEEKADVEVDIEVKAISADKTAGTGIVEVNTSAPIVAKLQVDLSDPKVHWLATTSGIWFDVPRYWSSAERSEKTPAKAPLEPGIGRPRARRQEAATSESTSLDRFPEGVGFAMFDVAVSDSDASNVRKVLESGAKKLDEKKDGIADSVGSIFE